MNMSKDTEFNQLRQLAKNTCTTIRDFLRLFVSICNKYDIKLYATKEEI
mgnify:CR=1 FL=1